MTVLVLLGLVMACAKLWFEVGALRARLLVLESGTPLWPEVIEPARPIERAVHAPDVPAAEAMPPLKPEAVEDLVPEPPSPLVGKPLPDPVAEEPVEAPAPRGGGFEDLFGRKLPIWAGGITLAVAGFLIVKYSIDAGLLSPIVRVVLGMLFGTGLIAGAEAALRADERVRDPRVRQALSGAGLATLYATILAAANLYQLVGPITAFIGMALTTVLAGGLSLRFGAPSAVLGLVGGLAAPALVGSGTPDVPLLSAYLALTVGGLCALSRNQRWMWLGVAALTGGFGWGALLLLNGALDLAATLSIGSYTLLLGIGLPLLAFGGSRGTVVRLAGSLAACGQLAGLLAIGGFGALEWGLFALVSVAIVWLSRREAALAELPAAGMAVALLLVAAWPAPEPAMLAMVLAGVAMIFGLPAAKRVWSHNWRPSDAIQVAVIAGAIAVLPALQLDLGDQAVASLALLGGALSAIVAALGWTVPERSGDARFATLAATAATLMTAAAMIIAPVWCAAPIMAIAATGLLILAQRARDPRLDWIAPAFGMAAIVALVILPGDELRRAVGAIDAPPNLTAALRWMVPALAAVAFALRSGRFDGRVAAQPVAVLLGYVAAAQVVPVLVLPLIPMIMLVALTLKPRFVPALVTAGAVTAGWAALPFATWLAAGGGAVLGMPMLVGALPNHLDTLLRLALPAAAATFVAWRLVDLGIRRIAMIGGGVLAAVAVHIGFKQLFAIADAEAFVRLGMAERTLWEMLLAGGAVALWRRAPVAGRALAAASLAHFGWFTLLLHDPLWTLQAVGEWPVANLLLPAFGTAFALTWLARKLPLSQLAMRAREWVQMVLILAFAAATLRQAFHGSLLSAGGVGEGEDIAQSVLLIALGIGFLRRGIVSATRDWRIASLALMLGAVGKVFLVDAAGRDGLLRIASFASLGFSLIGIGWLYARYLPEDTALTHDSEMSATPAGGN
jgi:uncharacterized membrane protein